MGGPSLHGGHIPSRLLVTGALAILGVVTPAAHAGTVTILSQFREIDASAGDVLVTRAAEPGNFGTFDAVAEADVSDESGIARARSTVNSRLGQDGFFFSGTTSYEKNFFDSSQGTGPKVGHHLGFRVEFSVDAPYRYEFVAVGRGTTTPSGVSEDSGAEFEFSGDTDALGDPGDTGIIQPARIPSSGPRASKRSAWPTRSSPPRASTTSTSPSPPSTQTAAAASPTRSRCPRPSGAAWPCSARAR